MELETGWNSIPPRRAGGPGEVLLIRPLSSSFSFNARGLPLALGGRVSRLQNIVTVQTVAGDVENLRGLACGSSTSCGKAGTKGMRETEPVFRTFPPRLLVPPLTCGCCRLPLGAGSLRAGRPLPHASRGLGPPAHQGPGAPGVRSVAPPGARTQDLLRAGRRADRYTVEPPPPRSFSRGRSGPFKRRLYSNLNFTQESYARISRIRNPLCSPES